MKFDFFDLPAGSQITIKPETAKETAALLRMVKSAKSGATTIALNFHDANEDPECTLWIGKVNKKVQLNSIRKKI